MEDLKKIFLLLHVLLLVLVPYHLFLLQPKVISCHILVYADVPLLQVLLQLLLHPLLQLQLLHLEAVQLDSVDDLDVRQGLLASHMGVDI